MTAVVSSNRWEVEAEPSARAAMARNAHTVSLACLLACARMECSAALNTLDHVGLVFEHAGGGTPQMWQRAFTFEMYARIVHAFTGLGNLP